LSSPYYETERALSEYLLFHYGTPQQILPYPFGPIDALHFPVRCVSECLLTACLPSAARALDLGCAVGRSTFELARSCAEVIGIDFSAVFIAAARQLRQDGALNYRYAEQGELFIPARALLPADIDRQRVTFEQGDAQELREDLGAFDVVLMANLIDRLRAPKDCLRQLPALVRTGGQLIIVSPYTWLNDFTPRENWLGGFELNGRRIKTLDTLKELLAPSFALTAVKDLPFLIREHERKFQWSVAQGSTWMRHEKISAD